MVENHYPFFSGLFVDIDGFGMPTEGSISETQFQFRNELQI